MDPFEQDSDAFLDWFRQKEGTRVSDKIQIADLRTHGAGRAVLAAQDILDDEELFAMPKALILHAQTSDLTKHLSHPLPNSDPWLPLILTIIYEVLRGGSSPWSPYLRLLPATFDTLMFWTEEELAQLKGSQVVHKIGRENADENWRERLVPFMLEHPELYPCSTISKEEQSQELIRYAHRAGSLIMAYAFDVAREDIDAAKDEASVESTLASDDEEDSTFKAMVPFADLLNADADRNNAKLFDDDDYLIMKSIAPIKAGEQIFNDYGPLPRSDLLRKYGYITSNYAQYDVVELLQSDITAVAHNMKRSVKTNQSVGRSTLHDLDLLEDGYVIQRSPSTNPTLVDAIPAELHMLLRALSCNLGNGSSCMFRTIKNGSKEDVTIEEASLLAAVCTKRLTDFPGRSGEEAGLLQPQQASASSVASGMSNVSPLRMNMAIEVCNGEKEILHGISKLCQDHITKMTSEIKNEASRVKRKHQSEDGMDTKKGRHKRGKSAGLRRR